MISAIEAARGVYGAWRLAHGDRGGLAYFDSSMDGYWRSFGAAIVALPAYAVLVGLAMVREPGEINIPGVMLIEAIAYTMDWFAFPLAAVYLARTMGKEHTYARLIVALNWARVVEAAVMVPAALVATLAGQGPLAFIPIVIFVGIMVYHWWVTRVALDVTPIEAVMVVVVNLGIGVAIALWAHALLYKGLPPV